MHLRTNEQTNASAPMKKLIFTLFSLVLFQFTSQAQTDVKAYYAIDDGPGLAVEQHFMRFYSVEFGGSYVQSSDVNFFIDADIRNISYRWFLNGAFKIYLKENEFKKFYVGAYTRYKQEGFKLNNNQPFTAAQQAEIDANNSRIQSYSQKYSLGLLAGYKFVPLNKLVIDFTGGFGGSLPFMFTNTSVYKDYTESGSEGPNEIVGYLTHLSIIMAVKVGYRF